MLWIIGLGNPARGDDGIGLYVIHSLGEILSGMPRVHVLACRQLAPELVEALRDAKWIILVDACIDASLGEVRRTRLNPDPGGSSCLTHHCEPSFFLSLFQAVHNRTPLTWLVSVPGKDFGFGEGLTPEAREGAETAIREIARFSLDMLNGEQKARSVLCDPGVEPIKSVP